MASAVQSVSLDPHSFRTIADLVYRESGIQLVEGKATMIQSRLRHRLRALGLAEFSAYCRLVQSENGEDERRHLISALTTNVSHFFREKHHFEQLAKEVRLRLPLLRAGASLRIWSAGCSNGQEAASAAMTILDEAADADTLDIRILATDIDGQVIHFARKGQYPKPYLGGVSRQIRERYFVIAADQKQTEDYRLSAKVKKLIRYNELNLLDPWPMVRKFDIIFCRNVVIYFDTKTQCRLWPKFRMALADDGCLFLGHSERILDPEKYGFTVTGPTTYRPA